MPEKTPIAEHPTEIRAVLKAQCRAGFQMLQQAIDECPDHLWLSREGHDAPYWQIAFHALFFTHFYLQKDEGHMKRWAGHRDHLQDLQAKGQQPYTKREILDYLEFCRAGLDGWLAAMDLGSADCGFPWYGLGKLEHQFNNIRHLQHHTAQLGDRLRSVTGHGLDWTINSL